MDINAVINLALGATTGIITFFLKRVINELDKAKKDISDIKADYASKAELEKCENSICKIKENYITKEDFYRVQNENIMKLDRIMDILLEIKGGK